MNSATPTYPWHETLSPIPQPPGSIQSIGAFAADSWVLMSDGSLYVAGENTSGEFGLGRSQEVPVWTLTQTGVTQMRCGTDQCYHVRSDGTLRHSGVPQYRSETLLWAEIPLTEFPQPWSACLTKKKTLQGRVFGLSDATQMWQS